MNLTVLREKKLKLSPDMFIKHVMNDVTKSNIVTSQSRLHRQIEN